MYSSPRKSNAIKKGTPGWIVTFADMMALLLTFFIMLLSFSTMDTQKYKAVVESMEEAFGPGVGTDKKGLVTMLESMKGTKKADFEEAPIRLDSNSEEKPEDVVRQTTKQTYNNFMEKARSLLNTELLQGTLEIETINSNIIIRFPERVAFASGSAVLSSQFGPVIQNLKKVLAEIPGEIIISGHTDDVPINTFRFRSNWELSSARAVSVLHAILQASDLDPERFTVQGHADTQPIVLNNSDANRAENRRVEIAIQGAGAE